MRLFAVWLSVLVVLNLACFCVEILWTFFAFLLFVCLLYCKIAKQIVVLIEQSPSFAYRVLHSPNRKRAQYLISDPNIYIKILVPAYAFPLAFFVLNRSVQFHTQRWSTS